MTAKKRSRAAAGAARLPKPKKPQSADSGKVPAPSAGGIGVSTGSPSAAWLRMKEKAKDRAEKDRATEPTAADGRGDSAEAGGRPFSAHRRRRMPGQETLFAIRDDTLHPLEDVRRRAAHEAMNCPYCIAPEYIQKTGWPNPCRCRITDLVECESTASAEEISHHYSCPYWDHTDGLPF